VFGIVTAGYMDKAMRDFLVARDGAIADVIDHTPRAASFFIDPTGEVISEVLQDEEGIAYAEIDLSRCVERKQFHDVVGYYNRFDIFDLSIDRTRLTPARFFDDAQAVAASGPPGEPRLSHRYR
jgi:aliphatic nitrilase